MTRRRHTATHSRSRSSFQLYAPHRTLWFVALLLFVVGLLGTVLDAGLQIGRDVAIWSLILAGGLLLLGTAARTSRP